MSHSTTKVRPEARPHAIPGQRPGKPSEPLSPAERADAGKAARTRASREDLAAFTPARDRPDPVGLLEEQAKTRVQSLVPVRYGRMLVSPFSYFRGAALPMAADLSSLPVSGLEVQACGDAHLSNFGFFASPERNLIFDVNDFDETQAGPWEWDVKRLAASLEVAGRDNGYAGKDSRRIVTAAARAYRRAMRRFAKMTNLDLWYAAADAAEIRGQFEKQMSARQRKVVAKSADKARTRDSTQALGKLTTRVGDSIRIVADPPLIVPLADMLADEQQSAYYETQLMRLIGKYRRTLESDRRALLDQYSFADMAMKVVGVGSVGTRCWIALMLGRDNADPLFMQVKEAQESVLSRYWRAPQLPTEGARVVAGQRLMQTVSDIFLGYVRAEGLDGQTRDFYLRQLRDWKFSLPIEQMIPQGMRMYGELCGWTLARAHARSGDPIAISAYLGGSGVFDNAIADFAASYADQNQRDYDRLAQAAKAGEIPVERGV